MHKAVIRTKQNFLSTKGCKSYVASKTIYGGTYNLPAHTFPQYGITTTFVDPDEENAFENAIWENTKAVFIETLGNPNSNIIDIEKTAEIAHAHKIPLVIHPATTTHSQLNEEELAEQGIKPNTIRLSIGTENIDDIIGDLEQGFKAVR